ncbi:MAG TPA: hypothetical protein VGL07_16725 [Buttiauxella sp.]|jgi:hypothetical protein
MQKKPAPALVKAVRLHAGFTAESCSKVMGYTLRAWQRKEDSGKEGRSLSVGEFKYLQLLAGVHPEYILTPRDPEEARRYKEAEAASDADASSTDQV